MDYLLILEARLLPTIYEVCLAEVTVNLTLFLHDFLIELVNLLLFRMSISPVSLHPEVP